MTFPISPANNSTTTINGITYVYSSANNAWTRVTANSLTLAGNLSVGGISSNLIPTANVIYNLGSPTRRWKDLWLSGNTIFIGSEAMSVSPAGQWSFTSGGATVNLGSTAAFNPPEANIGGVLTASGNIVAAATTVSTSSTTGALVVNGGAGISGNLNLGSNLSLTGIGQRFIANMSSTTQSDRFAFQTSMLNNNTNIIGIPNGTSTQTTWQAFGNSDPNNSHRLYFGTITSTDTRIVSDATGTANVRPMVFVVGSTEVLRFDTNARCIIGANSTVSTSAALLQIVQPTSAAVTIASNSTPTSSASFAGLDGWAGDGSTYFAGATINFRASENWSATNHGSLIQFRTTAAGPGGTLTERARIESTGNIVVTGGWIIPSGNVTQNLGSTTAWWNLVYGKSVQAQYADLAENYVADKNYVPGTVVVFGGDAEITATTTDHDPRVAGVISTDPAYLMNAASDGLPVALTGRVPCMVLGPVDKGDRLVTSKMSGVAQRLVDSRYTPGCIFAKSLEKIERSEVKLIEVAVGRD